MTLIRLTKQSEILLANQRPVLRLHDQSEASIGYLRSYLWHSVTTNWSLN